MIKFVLLIIAIMLIWGVSIRNRLKQYLVVIDESKESVDIAECPWSGGGTRRGASPGCGR